MQHSEGFLSLVDLARAGVEEIQAEALPEHLARRPDSVVVDVREDDEWRQGHLACAVHLGKGVIERDIEASYPNRDTPLYLYCGGGFRSVLAAEALQRMGYRQVVSVDGGWKALRQLMATTA